MTQTQFNKWCKFFITTIAVLLVVLIALLIVLIVVKNTTPDTHEIPDYTSDTTDSDEPQRSTTPDTTTKPDTTIPDTTTPTPTLSEQLDAKYAAVYEWQKWYDDQDFGSEQMLYLYECCQTYDIPMEFMLALIATESSFRSGAQASTSSATGYCQVTKGTAEWVYEDLLRRGTYDIDNHRELMKNWKLNMDISTKLVSWLYNRWGSYEMAAQRYYGSTDSVANAAYADRIDARMTELFGMTIADIEK